MIKIPSHLLYLSTNKKKSEMLCKQSSLVMLVVLIVLLLLMYPGSSIGCPFNISCTEDNIKILELPANPIPIKLAVSYVNFTSRQLDVYDLQNCLPRLLLRLNYTSFFPFYFRDSGNMTFFNCSSSGQQYVRSSVTGNPINSNTDQDIYSCPIYIIDSEDGIVESDLAFCTKLFDRIFPWGSNYDDRSWREIKDGSVTWVWSETSFDRQCLEIKCDTKKKKTIAIILYSTAVIIGTIVLVLVFGTFRIYRHFKLKGEDHVRIENFLRDYKALKPTRFSYADIKRIRHQFKDKLGEGAHGSVYKGKLSAEILVAVKMLNNTEGDGNEFINEVGTMGKIHHLNIVRLLGFCADGFYRALVYDFFPNGSLQNFISPLINRDTFLGWDKMQQIPQGIANGIEYLHQGCNQRILHFDINPHNVLLDDNFTPKITDFGLAKLCKKNQSTVSMTVARGTLGYMAPEVFSRNFGNVSYKSDIYSYGMLLLEMVGGRKNTNITGEENLKVLYPDWIHNLLEGRDIQIPIDEEGDFRIAKKLAIVGLWCIQWHPTQRPSMKTVVNMLQGEGDMLEVPHNPFEPTTSSDANANTSAKPMNMELEVIQELD